jgi:2'-5' RNA ligase
MRLFLAVDIPEDIRRGAGDLVRDVNIPTQKVRWVKRENLHITLKFLGETPKERLGAVAAGARRVAAGFTPIYVLVEGAGVFPNKIKPRIFWLGIKGDTKALERLAEELDAALALAGFAREERPFSAHLTLGRVQVESAKGQVIRAATAHKDISFGSFTVDRLVLYESVIGPGGPKYTPLGSFPFGGGR